MRQFLPRVLLVLGLLAGTAHAHLPVTPVGPSFPPGPYTALAVDPARPDVIAVATADGQVAWSADAGRTAARESRAISPRRYDALAMRGNTKVAQYSRPTGTGRATRLFMSLLREGHRPTRWAHWMALGEPITELTALALPPGDGPILAAGPAGILLSDAGRGSWIRVVGGPGPMNMDVHGLAVAIDPSDPSRVLAGTSKGVLVSRNGGRSFVPHADLSIAGEVVHRIVWHPAEPRLVLAITVDTIHQSDDGGATFSVAFSAGAVIRAVALSAEGAYVSTDAGLYVVGDDGHVEHLLRGQAVVGAVPLGGDVALAATEQALLLLLPGEPPVPLRRTSIHDPFVALEGTPDLAWALTRHGILRIGAAEPRRERAAGRRRPPRLAMSAIEVERAVVAHLGIPTPEETRLHPRWHAHLLPRLVVQVYGSVDDERRLFHDGLFPLGYRQATHALGVKQPELLILARWDLSRVVFGDESNVVNPHLFLESNLRNHRERILAEVRARYRECAGMAALLDDPPADPEVELLWRLRLEEHCAYLEGMSGRPILKEDS